jgi:hypothetical protein
MLEIPAPYAMHHPKSPNVTKGITTPFKLNNLWILVGWMKHYVHAVNSSFPHSSICKEETYERQLGQPHEEETQQLLRGNICRRGQRIRGLRPLVSEHAPEHYGQKICAVHALDAIPDDAYDGAGEDEKVGTVEAKCGARENGAVLLL